jgi:hypothetical protein
MSPKSRHRKPRHTKPTPPRHGKPVLSFESPGRCPCGSINTTVLYRDGYVGETLVHAADCVMKQVTLRLFRRQHEPPQRTGTTRMRWTKPKQPEPEPEPRYQIGHADPQRSAMTDIDRARNPQEMQEAVAALNQITESATDH